MWYKVLKDKYNAKKRQSLALRIQGITCSSTFTYQQPLNNIVRNSARTIAAALSGVQALGTASYDEAITVPTESAAINAIRTQQIIQHESGIPNVVDPLGGSYYVEWLTDEIERRAWEYMQKIESKGGFLTIIENGWAYDEAIKESIEWERKIASGEWKWVGVNCFQMEDDLLQVPAHKPNPKVWEEAMARLEKLRKERNNKRVKEALEELRAVALSDENIMPAMMKAVQAGVTVGEVGNLWRELFGVWKSPLAL
jgi:methylmalonyl-CoA mutase N-terminal domain/subunit